MNEKEREEGFSPPLPEDFPERLERLIELAGMSREEFAQGPGIDYDRVAQWFDGAVLTGGEVWHVAGWRIRSPGAWRPSCRRRPGTQIGYGVSVGKHPLRRNYTAPLPPDSSVAT